MQASHNLDTHYKNMDLSRPLFAYFRPFHITVQFQIDKEQV